MMEGSIFDCSSLDALIRMKMIYDLCDIVDQLLLVVAFHQTPSKSGSLSLRTVISAIHEQLMVLHADLKASLECL